jgi:nicotinate-nucleotide adenylyltransferase
MRLGVFGGSFDPVHLGHLLLAECCREACRLDAVWFVPAAIAPHKQETTPTEAHHRVAMLELATGGHSGFAVCRHEVERGGVTYTVDTLEVLASEDPARELFLLLGADSLVDLPNWRSPERICELATLAVVRRAGTAAEEVAAAAQGLLPDVEAKVRVEQVEMPAVSLSASDIRQRVALGQSIRYRTPAAVAQYIRASGLYAGK